MSNHPRVTVARLEAPLGARIKGLDGTRPLDAETVLALKQALRDHHILIIENQDLTEEQLKVLGTHFGSIFQNPADVPVLASGDGGVAPEVVRVSNIDGYTGAGELPPHADHQWTPYPSAGSLLYALEVPASGGNTSFYNMNLAYETLDDLTKRRIADLKLITYNPFLRKEGEERPRYRVPGTPLISPTFPHPLVRTHPESGKKVLFLGYRTEVEVLGLPFEEGRALVEQLRAHFHDDRFRYEHRWAVGDVVYWDNQAVLHSRSAFDPNSRRVMKRVSLAGSRPF
ncbi:MAG: taurine dioxygenase [Myxococcaceae bacterium]|nr:taurine dioxygenase [Myxococcaceae bacterium]